MARFFLRERNSNKNKQMIENQDFMNYRNHNSKLILYHFRNSRQLEQERKNKMFSVNKQYTIYLHNYTCICKVYCIYSQGLSLC